MVTMTEQPPVADSQPTSAAICVDSDAFDRLGRVLRHLTVGLVDQAIPLRLVSSDPRIEKLALGPVQTLLHEPISWLGKSRRLSQIVDGISSQPPLVVHATSAGTFRLAQHLAEVFEAELILQISSMADCEALARIPQERIATLLSYSTPLSAVLQEQLKIDNSRIALIRPGILASKTATTYSDPSREATVICTSALERNAGIETLIDAVHKLSKRGISMLLFFVGRGRHETPLRRAVRSAGLSSTITFADPMGDPLEALCGADVFVTPGAESGFRVDSLHAMAQGVATIGVENPLCDHIRNDETAIVCKPGSSDELANALAKLLTDRNYARQLAGRACDYARTNHSLAGMAENTASLYRKLALVHKTIPISP